VVVLAIAVVVCASPSYVTCCCAGALVCILPQVLYPAMRHVMGDAAPDGCLVAHDTLKVKLTALTNTHITDPNFDAMVQDYMKVGGTSADLQALEAVSQGSAWLSLAGLKSCSCIAWH
jgi:hypothetical protein